MWARSVCRASTEASSNGRSAPVVDDRARITLRGIQERGTACTHVQQRRRRRRLQGPPSVTGARPERHRRCPRRSAPPVSSDWPWSSSSSSPAASGCTTTPARSTGSMRRSPMPWSRCARRGSTRWPGTVDTVGSRCGLGLMGLLTVGERGVVPALAAPHLVPDQRGALRCRWLEGLLLPRVAAAAVRRHHHRSLGGLFGTLAPDGRSRGRDRRHRVHARGARPTPDARQVRRRRRAARGGACCASTSGSTTSPTRCSG